MINVVSNDEPPAVGETEQERLAREARNIDGLISDKSKPKQKRRYDA